MGFFSWKTCDTNESVMNVHTPNCRTVYFLQPDGKPSIMEDSYDGSGVFGDTSAYEWLLEENAEHLGLNLDSISSEQAYMAGAHLAEGTLCKDIATGEYWVYAPQKGCFQFLVSEVEPEAVINTFVNWGHKIPEYGTSANDLVKTGAFKRIDVSEILEIKYPIKLSFNFEAKYEDYPASENCPNQGYFNWE